VAPEEQYAYTKHTEAERAAIEEQAEDMDEFAALMIAYAEAHPEDFPLAEPVDPIANMGDVVTDLRREAESKGEMDEAKKATMEAAEQAMKDFQAIFQGLREPEIEKSAD